MTLTDLIDPQKLTYWMGSDPFDATKVEETAKWWKAYRAEKQMDYADSVNKKRTWTLFVMECCREGLGIKKGTCESMRARALENRPDLYTPNGEAT